MSDPVHLRSLSGAWFHEERAKRYEKGGADVVHASLRRKRRGKGHMIYNVSLVIVFIYLHVSPQTTVFFLLFM